MPELFNRILSKIYKNGIKPYDSQYEIEKQVAFNWQIFICILVSGLLVMVGLVWQFYLLTFLSFTYLLLFSACFYFINKNQANAARNTYLFTTNYSVFSISFCFGYEAGFYFYFFTAPLTVFITYGNYKPKYIYLAVSTYLVNAFILNFLHHRDILVNTGVLSGTATNILFNINMVTAFFMCFMFVDSLTRINKMKSKEEEDLHQKQRLLEAEIHEKQLNETKVQFQYQKLEGEYQQLDMFSHIISHNLRGPISRVSGILELLKMHPYSSEEQQKLMEHLNSSVLLIDDVIRDLNYILVQKKLGQESTDLVSLQEILQEVKLHLSEDIKTSGAEIHAYLYEEKINCVKAIMISIFYNLISNSIKYAIPNQKPVITIEEKKTDNFLELTFHDEGIGFDAVKYSDKVFRLYNRFHNHVSGKGMGLFLVKSHVDILNGTIEVQSEPRKGAKFMIRLPLFSGLSLERFNQDDSEEPEGMGKFRT